MPFIQNKRKTPVVIASSSGDGAHATLCGARKTTTVPLRDWLAFKKNWLGQHAIAEGWLVETDQAPEDEPDDDEPRAA